MKKEAVNEGGLWTEPLLTRPNKVAIVCLGTSSKYFVHEQQSNDGMNSPFDEVWTLNRGLRAYRHDKLFVMDDLKWLEKDRPPYAKWLKKHDEPIITSTPYQDYPMSVAYPLHEVIATIEDDAFCVNTVAYMLAYAIHIRVKDVYIYGADFIYPSGDTSEFGGQAVTYLMGMMKAYGLTFHLPQETTLLYANRVKIHPQTGQQRRELYGYHRLEQMEAKKVKEAQRKKEQKGAK